MFRIKTRYSAKKIPQGQEVYTLGATPVAALKTTTNLKNAKYMNIHVAMTTFATHKSQVKRGAQRKRCKAHNDNHKQVKKKWNEYSMQ